MLHRLPSKPATFYRSGVGGVYALRVLIFQSSDLTADSTRLLAETTIWPGQQSSYTTSWLEKFQYILAAIATLS